MQDTEKITSRIRREALGRRSGMDPLARKRKSDAIISHLRQLSDVTEARVLFIYVHFRTEVQTASLLEACLDHGQTVCVPLTIVNPPSLRAVRITHPKHQLEPGYCSIPEPTAAWTALNTVDPLKIDVVLVPGSAFDLNGGRLGYGGGFYDRFLAGDAPQATRIGLAFSEQIVEKIPLLPHDQRMDMLVTEKGIFQCRRKKLEKNSSIP